MVELKSKNLLVYEVATSLNYHDSYFFTARTTTNACHLLECLNSQIIASYNKIDIRESKKMSMAIRINTSLVLL